MGIFFGTDGIRGRACEELTYDLAYKCGNSLATIKENSKIIIGRDTRTSGSYLSTAFSLGAMSGGANVIDIGICTTPGIAYITKRMGADFGVVVSASHNPAEYNGIKIFDNNGYKLGDERENNLEKKFINQIVVPFNKVGTLNQQFENVNLYYEHLKKSIKTTLTNLKIVIDASNGASYKIAPKVFKELGAEVIEIHCENDGANINNGCGSLHPEHLVEKVIECGANMGFAFDGDADRIIACDENGNILDGDTLIFVIAKHLKQKNKLNSNTIVGTRHTNMGIEDHLKQFGIKLIRTDIGDKYVLEEMIGQKLNLGGEKSGHIILGDFSTTGDGVLTALKICEIVKNEEKTLGELTRVQLYPQVNIDVIVADKMKVINSEKLSNAIEEQEKCLGNCSRVMVRVSGTEPKIRIMVETKDKQKAIHSAKKIETIVKEVDRCLLCVE